MTPALKLAGVIALFLWGMLAVALLRPALRRLGGRLGEHGWDSVQSHWHRCVGRVLGLRLKVVGDFDAGAGLLVGNHISWLDVVALGGLAQVDFIAKSDMAGWPVLGFLAQKTDTLFLHRGDAGQTQSIAEQMAWRLRQGRRLMLFPEGTTTAGDRVLRFHPKLFQPARLAATRVQAVALRYGGDAATVAPFIGEDAFVPHLWRLLQLPRIDLQLQFCPPLAAGIAPAELARAARAQVVEVLRIGDDKPSVPAANRLLLNRNQTPAVL